MRKSLPRTNFISMCVVLAAFSLFGATHLVGTFQSSVDNQRLYAEIAGD